MPISPPALGPTGVIVSLPSHRSPRRETFGRMHTLIPLADSVELLAGQCRFCESPSRFTLRIAASSGQVLVGGAEAYAPVCRRHYVEMHSVREGPLPEESEGEAEAGRAQ